MNVINFPNRSEARAMLQARDASVLKGIHRRGVGAAIWQRDRAAEFADWVNALSSIRFCQKSRWPKSLRKRHWRKRLSWAVPCRPAWARSATPPRFSPARQWPSLVLARWVWRSFRGRGCKVPAGSSALTPTRTNSPSRGLLGHMTASIQPITHNPFRTSSLT